MDSRLNEALHKLQGYLRIALLTAIALAASLAFAQRLYRWVDDDGVVHYGDRIPPQYADRDRALLNSQGVPVGREQGTVTPEERAALEKQEQDEAEAREARAETARRDRMLLETYLSVEDIEDLRDRRLELLQSQIDVTENYLQGLRERLRGLHAEASKYKPYSDREGAAEVPADLASEISNTMSSIASYEHTLERTSANQAKLTAQFDSDIERFRELKGE